MDSRPIESGSLPHFGMSDKLEAQLESFWEATINHRNVPRGRAKPYHQELLSAEKETATSRGIKSY
jgi:hypothetical protein